MQPARERPLDPEVRERDVVDADDDDVVRRLALARLEAQRDRVALDAGQEMGELPDNADRGREDPGDEDRNNVRAAGMPGVQQPVQRVRHGL